MKSSRVPLAEPGKSDVLFELHVKEQQFEKALAASLEISFQTTVTAEEPGSADAAAQSSTDAAFLSGRGGTRRGTDVHYRDSRPGVRRRGADLQRRPGKRERVGSVDVIPSMEKTGVFIPAQRVAMKSKAAHGSPVAVRCDGSRRRCPDASLFHPAR